MWCWHAQPHPHLPDGLLCLQLCVLLCITLELVRGHHAKRLRPRQARSGALQRGRLPPRVGTQRALADHRIAMPHALPTARHHHNNDGSKCSQRPADATCEHCSRSLAKHITQTQTVTSASAAHLNRVVCQLSGAVNPVARQVLHVHRHVPRQHQAPQRLLQQRHVRQRAELAASAALGVRSAASGGQEGGRDEAGEGSGGQQLAGDSAGRLFAASLWVLWKAPRSYQFLASASARINRGLHTHAPPTWGSPSAPLCFPS